MNIGTIDVPDRAFGSELLCLYGIVRADDGLPASPASPLGAIVHGRLAALVEPVPARLFTPEALETNLASIEWVTLAARRHEALLESAMQAGPVIPARLCTLFSSREAVVRMLADDEDVLSVLLERLVGKQEHGLKVYCDEGPLRRHVVAGDAEARRLAEAAEAASPGQSYVLTRQRDARVVELATLRIEEVQDRVLDLLEELDIDLRIKPALPATATMRDDRMVLNLAALVETASRGAFEALLADLAAEFAAEGFCFEQSGPWPAYSFTGQESPQEYDA